MSEELLTLEGVLSRAAAVGLELSERTFRYYAVMGLLPAPVKRPSGTEDARVHYYPAEIIDLLLEIRNLQAQGYSLKQIKAWLEMKPESPRPAHEKRAHGPDASRVLAFLSGTAPREAGQAFLRETLADRREETLRRAALQYYCFLVGALLGPHGETAARNTVAEMAPLQADALLHPLRRWRDAERLRRISEAEPPVLRALREAAARRVAGLPVDAERLSAYAAALDGINRRLKRLSAKQPPAFERPLSALTVAVDRLSHVATMLSRDGNAAEAIASLDRAGAQLQAASSILTAWQRLVEN